MGRGGARTALAAAILALGVGAVAGCGAETHSSQPRPQPPTRVSVSISPQGVTVQPRRIAVGPEPNQQLPQNRRQDQPRVQSDRPLDVVFVTANQTGFDSHLRAARPAPIQLRLDPRQQPRHLPGQPPQRRLHDRRRRHPRRPAGEARRRPLPVLLRERRAAALSRCCTFPRYRGDKDNIAAAQPFSPAAACQRSAISPASSRGAGICRTSPPVSGERRANSNTVDIRRQRFPRVPVIPTNLS